MNSLLFIPVLLVGCLLGGCGSRSSDISGLESVENPLPPCPDSPNCIRTTKEVNISVDLAYDSSVVALQSMKPYELRVTPDDYRIESVFVVLFFSDDMIIQLTPTETGNSYLHIRSASRTGYHDFGVNTRRVRTFLEKLDEIITGE